jgi:hypothetical protein
MIIHLIAKFLQMTQQQLILLMESEFFSKFLMSLN